MAERTFSELPDASGRFVLGATVSRFTSSHFRASIDGSMFNACMKRGKGKPMNGQTAFQKGEAAGDGLLHSRQNSENPRASR